MDEFKVWNCVWIPSLHIKDRFIAKRVEEYMQPYKISDDKVKEIKHAFEQEMAIGLNESNSSSSLPMRVTHVTDRFKQTEGDFVSICTHTQYFNVTLVKLRDGLFPEVVKKDYYLDTKLFQQPHSKIFEAFADCVKYFFYDTQSDGKCIPTGVCTDFHMIQFSIDTAVIPSFHTGQSEVGESDVKSFFEEILTKESYQGDAKYLLAVPDNINAVQSAGSCDAVNLSAFTAKYLGRQNVSAEAKQESYQRILLKLKSAFILEKTLSDVSLEVSQQGIYIKDKLSKKLLFHHPIHSILIVIQDLKNACVFGYASGNLIDGYTFYGFKTDLKSAKVVFLLKEVIEVTLQNKRKEEIDLKTSQVFISLFDFLELAMEFVTKEQEVPILLNKRINLVEDISWWSENCLKVVKEEPFEPDAPILNMKLQEFYTCAVNFKLLETERLEEAHKKELKAKKRHRRKKKVKKKKVDKKTPIMHPSQIQISALISEQVTYFENFLKKRENDLEYLNQKIDHLKNEEFEEVHEFFNVLKDICSTICDMENEINDLNVMRETLNVCQEAEESKVNFKELDISNLEMQHLQTVPNEPNESLFKDFEFEIPEIGINQPEITIQLNTCKKIFLSAVKLRKEEVEELNYFISKLFYEDEISQEESYEVLMSRKLLVKTVKMILNEIEVMEKNFREINDMEKNIAYSVPKAIQFCLNLVESVIVKQEHTINRLKGMLCTSEKEYQISSLQFCQDIFFSLKCLTENEVFGFQNTIDELKTQVPRVDSDLSAFCCKLYKSAIERCNKEFDSFIINIEQIEEAEIKIIDENKAKMLERVKLIFFTNIIMREKEMEEIQYEIESSSTEKENPLTISLKDVFRTALEIQRCEIGKILGSKYDASNDHQVEVLPVIFPLKNLYSEVCFSLKGEYSKSSKDPFMQQRLEIHTSFRELIQMAFKIMQEKVEIPLAMLKSSFKAVLYTVMEDINKRESEIYEEHQRHIQALSISICYKEIFLKAIEIRKKEVTEIVPKQIRELIEKEAIHKELKKIDSTIIKNETTEAIDWWRKFLYRFLEIKEYEMEQLSQLLQNPDVEISIKEIQYSVLPLKYSAISENEEEKTKKKGGTRYEFVKMLDTCEGILRLVMNKGSKDLEEMQYEMRPIYNAKYDEEEKESEDEISNALNVSKKVTKEMNQYLKEQEIICIDTLDSLAKMRNKIKSYVNTAKEKVKEFLTTTLSAISKETDFIKSKMQEMDEAFKKFYSEGTSDELQFTDLVVDVLSSEDDSQSEAENDTKEGETKPKRLSKDEITSLLKEIDSQLKKQEEGNKMENLRETKAIETYKSCKKILLTLSDINVAIISNIENEIKELEESSSKKIKAKKQKKEALKYISSCKEVFDDILKTKKAEIWLLTEEIKRIAGLEFEKEEPKEFQSSEIIKECREKFSSFLAAREKALSDMSLELKRLKEKKNIVNIDDESKPDILSEIKSKSITACKELVIHAIDMRMKEVGEMSVHLDKLNFIEKKLEKELNSLDQLDSKEEAKSMHTELEEIKDAVSTSQKLFTSSIEKSKNCLKDTDEELYMLKEILESSKESLITNIYLQQLFEIIEKGKAQVENFQCELFSVTKAAEILEFQLINFEDSLSKAVSNDPSNAVSEDSSKAVSEDSSKAVSENSTSKAASKDFLSQDSVKENFTGSAEADILKPEVANNQESNLVNGNKEILDESITEKTLDDKDKISEIEKDISKNESLRDIDIFFNEVSELFSSGILQCKEDIHEIKNVIDKINDTITKVENEDVQVFKTYERVYHSNIQFRREEIEATDIEIKKLESAKEEAASEDESGGPDIDNVAVCKMYLEKTIQDREHAKQGIDFELMKLVRYQDSRILHLCQELLLTIVARCDSEISIIKGKINKLDLIQKNVEKLNICQEILLDFKNNLNKEIPKIEGDMISFVETRAKMQSEESQSIYTGIKYLSSQIVSRNSRIEVFQLVLDEITEFRVTNRNTSEEINKIASTFSKILEETILLRNAEIKDGECELIKRLNIDVSCEISSCNTLSSNFIESKKNDVVLYSEELEKVVSFMEKLDEKDGEAVLNMNNKCQNIISSDLERISKSSIIIMKELNVLQGKKKDSNEIDMMYMEKVNAPQRKLITEISKVLFLIKDRIHQAIILFEKGLNNLESDLSRKKEDFKPSVSSNQVESEVICEIDKLSSAHLSLMKFLDEERQKCVTHKETKSYSQKLISRILHRRKKYLNEIQNYLYDIEFSDDIITSKASTLIYHWKTFNTEVLNQEKKEKSIIEEQLQILNEIINLDDKDIILKNLEEVISLIIDAKDVIIAFVVKNLQILEEKETAYINEVSETFSKCKKVCQNILQIIGFELKDIKKDILDLDRLSDNDNDSSHSEDTLLTGSITDDNALEYKTYLINFSNELKNVYDDFRYQLLLPEENLKLSEKPNLLPSWCERFLHVFGSKLKGDNDEESQQEKSPNELDASSAIEDESFKYTLYENMLKSLEYKKHRMYSDCIPEWSDILLEAFLINKIRMHSMAGPPDIECEYSWDAMFRHAAKLKGKEKPLEETYLKNKKDLSIPLSPWEKVLETSIDDWENDMSKAISLLSKENTLLQWKKDMDPTEYSSLHHGCFYEDHIPDSQSESRNLQNLKMNIEIKNVSPEDYLLQNILDKLKYSKIQPHVDPATSWETVLFKGVKTLFKEDSIIEQLKQKSTEVQYKARRVCSSWNENVLKAIKSFKEENLKHVKEKHFLEKLAERIVKKMKDETWRSEFDFKNSPPDFTWSKSVLDNFNKLKNGLMKAVNPKRPNTVYEKPLKQQVDNELKKYAYLHDSPKNIFLDGIMFFQTALRLWKNQIDVKTKEFKSKLAQEKSSGNIKVSSVPLEVFMKIISSAVDLKKKGLSVPDTMFKKIKGTSANLFSAAEKIWVECMAKNSSRNKEKVNVPTFNYDQTLKLDDILLSIDDLFKKDMIKVQKFGLTKDINSQEQMLESENCSDEVFSSISWQDCFIAAARQKMREKFPKSLDLQSTVKKGLESKAKSLPSWNEIFYIMGKLNKERYLDLIHSKSSEFEFINNAEFKKIQNMASSNAFSWDFIIVSAIEEFLRLQEINFESKRLKKKSDTDNYNKPIALIIDSLMESFRISDELGKDKIWLNLCPKQKVSDKRFEAEVDLCKTRELVENPELKFKDYKISYHFIQENIFAFVVLEWEKLLGDYFNLCKNIFSMNKIAGEEISKVFPLINSLLEEKSKVKHFSKKKTECDISGEESVSEDTSEEGKLSQDKETNKILEPEYFSTPVSWRDIFLAAIERKKKVFFKLLNIEKLQLHLDSDEDSAENETELKFTGNAVLSLPISLSELVDAVSILKQENLVESKKLQEKIHSKSNLDDQDNMTESDINKIFEELLMKSLQYREKELVVLQKDYRKVHDLVAAEIDEIQTKSVLNTARKFLISSKQERYNENEIIRLHQENLDNFKPSLEFRIDKLLLQKNKSQLNTRKEALKNLEKQQHDFEKKLQFHAKRCTNLFLSLIEESGKIHLVVYKSLYSFKGAIASKFENPLHEAKYIFHAMDNLKKNEASFLEIEVSVLTSCKSMEDHDDMLCKFFASAERFLSDSLSQMSCHKEKISNIIEFLEKEKENLSCEISMVLSICKSYLTDALNAQKYEVKYLESELKQLKQKPSTNIQTLNEISSIEVLVEKFIATRILDIKLLEEQSSHSKTSNQIKKLHAYCKEYLKVDIEKKKSEMEEIEKLLYPTKQLEQSKDEKMSSDIVQALGEAFGICVEDTSNIKSDSLENVLPQEEVAIYSEFCSDFLEYITKEATNNEKKLDELPPFDECLTPETVSEIDKLLEMFYKQQKNINFKSKSLFSHYEQFKGITDKFHSDVGEILSTCKVYLVKYIEEITMDIEDIKSQLNTLLRSEAESKDTDDKKTFDEPLTGDHLTSKPGTNYDNNAPGKIWDEDKCSKYLGETNEFLKNASNWREKYIFSIINEMEDISKFTYQPIQLLSSCLENFNAAKENRINDHDKAENLMDTSTQVHLFPAIEACHNSLRNILHFGDSLNFLTKKINKLSNVIRSLLENKNRIFSICENIILTQIEATEKEMAQIDSDFSNIKFMGTSENSPIISEMNGIFTRGAKDRKKDILSIQNGWSAHATENEVLPVVSWCKETIKRSYKSKQDEVNLIRDILKVLADEGEMIVSLYAPPLRLLIQNNKSFWEIFDAEILKLSHIESLLKSEGKNLLCACKKYYFEMLETCKIEGESINCDLESLREIKIEVLEPISKVITSGEIVVSFKHLFRTAFHLKRLQLERQIQRKIFSDSLDKNKFVILQKIGKTGKNIKKGQNGFEDLSFQKLITYFASLKNNRRGETIEKILELHKHFESKWNIMSESEMVPTFTQAVESSKAADLNADSKGFINRVFEIKVQEIEKDIILKREKITNVIMNRKLVIEVLIEDEKVSMQEYVSKYEKQMTRALHSLIDEDTNLVCSLKSLYDELLEFKENENLEDSKCKIEVDFKGHQDADISVNLERIFETVLDIKKYEMKMLKKVKFKDIERSVLLLKREVDIRIIAAKDKLEKALNLFRQHEKAKAKEYAQNTPISERTAKTYSVSGEEIFPDIEDFKIFMKNSRMSETLQAEDTQSKQFFNYSGETCKNLSILKGCLPSLISNPNQLLKLNKAEATNLSKVLIGMNSNIDEAKYSDINFEIDENTLKNAAPSDKVIRKNILVDVTAVLNPNTCLLMYGTYLDNKCSVLFNLGRNFGMVYFERVENIKKWSSPNPDVKEVSIDVGIENFNTDFLDFISTEVDWIASTVPIGSSKFEVFIGDSGILEQIKAVFLELHHQQLLCRTCDFTDLAKDSSLTFQDLNKFLCAVSVDDIIKTLPVSAGVPHSSDAAIASYVSKLILIRGALLVSICISSVLTRLDYEDVTILTNSYLIQENIEYQTYIKKFTSMFVPEKTVNFLYCNSSNCNVGAAMAASVASCMKNSNAKNYMVELQKRIEHGNKFVSLNDFMKLLQNPETTNEALDLAHLYANKLKCGGPLSIAWAYKFMNKEYEDALSLYQRFRFSLERANFFICQKIVSDENYEMWTQYRSFLKNHEVDKIVKVKAYRTILDLLVARKMFDDAELIIQDCNEMGIPLNELNFVSVQNLHDFISQDSTRKNFKLGLPKTV